MSPRFASGMRVLCPLRRGSKETPLDIVRPYSMQQ